MIKFVGTAHDENGPLLYFVQTEDKKSTLKAVSSSNGFEFDGDVKEIKVLDEMGIAEQKFNWTGFRLSKQEEKYFITYKPSLKAKVLGAVSNDNVNYEKTGEIDGITETSVVVSDLKYRRHFVMYFGEKNLKIAYSAFLYFWQANDKPVLEPRKNFFDDTNLEAGNAFIVDGNILVTYYVKKGKRYSVGAAFFDKEEPTEAIWRSEEPVWEQSEDLVKDDLKPLGSAIVGEELVLYWVTGNNDVVAVSCPLPHKKPGIHEKPFSTIVKKHQNNPIISPRPEVSWESRATFNTAAIYDDGKVHFMYRALGDRDLSVIGHAVSSDGFTIDDRSDEPIYFPREPFETPGGNAFSKFADHYASGGGYGGVEDPRITKIDDKLYLTYVAFDGANPPRAAMSSIDMDDFRSKKWEKWAKAKLISAPGMINKSAVIFPKKVNGKYVVMHRVYPNILVDYLDNLEFEEYLQGHHFIPPRRKFWDSKKVGAGAPPMEK